MAAPVPSSARPAAALVLPLAGAWHIRHGLPTTDRLRELLAGRPDARRVVLDPRGLEAWDSALLIFLHFGNAAPRRGFAFAFDRFHFETIARPWSWRKSMARVWINRIAVIWKP